MNGNVTSQTSLEGSQSFDRETQGLESAIWSLKKKFFFPLRLILFFRSPVTNNIGID